MKIEFFPGGPAIVIENEERILVIADLHFGIEADLASHGLHFRSRSEARLERVLRIIEESGPDRLVLLGDVKHSIPALTWQEYHEMPKILGALRKKVPLAVFPGNHDIGISRFLQPGEVCPADGDVIDGTGYLHGHMYPAPELAGRLLVIGHHHPLVSLRDEVGCVLQAPALIRAGADAKKLGFPAPLTGAGPVPVLFMPAFNEIAGYDVAKIVNDPFSPISRCMDKETAEILLADGTLLGPLRAVVSDESG
ncbi:MAG: metallophosphoesterase [Methanomicrobiales archaeon]|nr:metallophosphoesterase [Methanomicrobiales archaeon]